ncbi:MAG TPA: hypothetical protein K8U89_00660 [Brachybacterium faecium]|nr:hypothetical protein [Brachybacterium faecium]
MTSALLGLALILAIASGAVALGALSRLLAARIVRPDAAAHRELTLADRVALGNALIARDLQPDDLHPVARTSPHGATPQGVPCGADGPVQRQDLALRYPAVAAHSLR